MILMQFNNENDKSSGIVIVIESDNLERMKTADPITLRPKAQRGFIEPIKYPDNLGILVAFESEIGRCYELAHDVHALIEYLSRGYKFNRLDGVCVSPGEKHGAA